MSIRTIVEFNHDYINELMKRGHISRQLRDALCSERTLEVYSVELSGIRRLAQRHHADTITLKIE
jgi:hypothetical protein